MSTSIAIREPDPRPGSALAQPSAKSVNGSGIENAETSCSGTEHTIPPHTPESDFPAPPSLTSHDEFIWNEDRVSVENYAALGAELSACGDLYRSAEHASGLVLAAATPNIPPTPITNAKHLAAIIMDRLRVHVVKEGKSRGSRIPTAHLGTMLLSECFLQQFRSIDTVTKTAMYLPGFVFTQPGYNDGGPGYRTYYSGETPRVVRTAETISRFLDVMHFASNADRTNSVAGALTVKLRNHFPGEKPVLTITGNKSHCGKDTVAEFVAGCNRITSVSYQETDWALERAFVGTLGHNPDTAVMRIENARLGKRSPYIASAFLERFIMDREPTLFSTGTGGPRRLRNEVVVVITTNFGTISEDLLNRSLPIHLEATGNVADRQSTIGNPKLEFLPANRQRIEAELRGMIENWKEAGSPRDTSVRHPFSQWAATIGGILHVNGFTDFLGNYTHRRTIEDPVRHALSILGAARAGQWSRAADWAKLAVDLGIDRNLIPDADRHSDKGRERGMGVVLSGHRDETYEAETDDERLTLHLEKARRRFDSEGPSTRYRFVVVSCIQIPEDDAPATQSTESNCDSL